MNYTCIVHAEKFFSDQMNDEFYYDLAKTVFTIPYDKIYIFCSEVEATRYDNGLIPFVNALTNLPNVVYVNWGWGYVPEQFENEEKEQEFVIRAYGHEYTWIPEEIRHFNSNDFVNLCGGCDSECLQDFRDILHYMKVPFKVKAIY